MARVQFSSGVEEIRGSIVGNTFSKNVSGNIIRSRKVPTQRVTEFQTGSLSATAQLQNIWRTLDETVVQDWNALAAAHTRVNMFGKTTQLSGALLFLSCNSNRVALGLSVLTDPPSWVTVPAPTSYSLLVSNSSVLITGFSSGDFATRAYIVYLSQLRIKTNNKYSRNIYRTAILSSYTAANVDLTAAYTSTFNLAFPLSSDSQFSICGRVLAIDKTSGINSAGLALYGIYP
jgi:hypothetical protein